MRFIYIFLVSILFFNTQSFTNLNCGINISDSTDSIYIHNIENEHKLHKDYIYEFDQVEYDFVATEDSILNLRLSINNDDSIRNSILEDYASELDSSYKNFKTDTEKLKSSKIQNLLKSHHALKVNEKKVDEKKYKIDILTTNIDLFSKKRAKLVKDYDSIIQNVSNYISKINNPIILNLQHWSSKFKVVLLNSNNYDLKIINNNTGALKSMEYFYSKLITTKPIVLMNAGMYEADGSAVGLLISDGKLIKNINLKKGLEGNFYKLSNAIFSIDSSGHFKINTTLSFNDNYNGKYVGLKYATQSGPVLITNGKINKELNLRSSNKLIRNGIGVFKNVNHNIAVLVISETPTSFYELASVFKFLNCDNAMYLDGTVSKLYNINYDTQTKVTKNDNNNMGLGPIFSLTEKDKKLNIKKN